MNIVSIPSPNFTAGRQNYRPEAVVIHIMEGTLAGTDSWFRNPQSKVSAHYGIGTAGQVHQFVQEEDTAWHAGRVNAPSWSLIKPAGNGLYINPNLYTIGIEHEGNETSDWTEAMYASSSALIAEICLRWNIPPDRNHIIGHHEIYSLKTCPGFKVDFNKMIALVRKKAGYPDYLVIPKNGTAVCNVKLNIRRDAPSSKGKIVRTASKGQHLPFIAYTDQGEMIDNVSRWYQTPEGYWFWGGGVTEMNKSLFV